MNARIAASSFHRLQVQNVLCASRSTWTPRLPDAFLACRDERSVCQMKPGRKRHDRNRSRVIDTNGMLNLEALQGSGVEQLFHLHQP